MTLREIIELIDSAYPDGLLLAYHDSPHEDHGDGLAHFIVAEIADTYDDTATENCQLETALRVMNMAAAEIGAVSLRLWSRWQVLSAPIPWDLADTNPVALPGFCHPEENHE